MRCFCLREKRKMKINKNGWWKERWKKTVPNTLHNFQFNSTLSRITAAWKSFIYCVKNYIWVVRKYIKKRNRHHRHNFSFNSIDTDWKALRYYFYHKKIVVWCLGEWVYLSSHSVSAHSSFLLWCEERLWMKLAFYLLIRRETLLFRNFTNIYISLNISSLRQLSSMLAKYPKLIAHLTKYPMKKYLSLFSWLNVFVLFYFFLRYNFSFCLNSWSREISLIVRPIELTSHFEKVKFN